MQRSPFSFQARTVAWPALTLLCVCACSPAPRQKPKLHGDAGPPQPAPPPPSAAELSPLQRARLAYLFDAARLLAKDWPWIAGDDTCVLLLAPEAQWVVHCPEAPATGFTRLPADLLGQPVFARRGGTFNSAGHALSTRELLAVMPAAAHVDAPGTRSSDLPPRYPWLLLGSLEGLTQYHAAFRDASTEEWLSVAMHEFLHTHQMRVPAFANDLRDINAHRLDPAGLDALYDSDRAYRSLVDREYALLVEAVQQPPSAAKAALRSWYALYRRRRAKLAARTDGALLVHSDSVFTYLEGTARYVESQFLVDSEQHPKHGIAGDARFHAFAKWEGEGYAAMPNRQIENKYYYAIGFHLSLLLDRAKPSWKQTVEQDPNLLLGEVQTP